MSFQTSWQLCEDGQIIIRFYANNSVGEIISGRVSILKDSFSPQIIINSPAPYEMFGNSTFNFDLTIIENNLNSTWYTLNDGAKNEFVGNMGTIDQGAWDACNNGSVLIRFYANDTAENVAFEEIIVRKNIHCPNITIISPTLYEEFSNVAPNFELLVIDPNLNTTWYTLNDGLKYVFSGTSGIINQSAWISCESGTVSIKFYANNSAGNTAFKEVIVKNIFSPIIEILSPTENQMFGSFTFNFNITIIDVNLDATWYSLNDGLTNYTFSGTSGTIEQSAWDNENDGIIILRFYANDSFGYIGYDEVQLIKDAISPYIKINFPAQNDLFGNSTFSFDLTINETYLQSTWYSLDGGMTNYTFSGTSGVISQSAWDDCVNGTVLLRFYARDSIGHVSSDEIIVRKDSINPEISILTPLENDLFGNTTFDFNLIIHEPNLDTTWYTFEGGVTIYFFSGLIGTIDQGAWDSCNEGVVHLRFYANDSLGNLGYTETTIIKDTIPPYIMVNYPEQYTLFGNNSLGFDLTINELYLESTWYTLDGGLNNYTFSGTNGTINQTAWDDCANGTILLRFYARDSVGHVSFDEVIIRKDNISPEISILTPIENTVFGDSTFNFTLVINEPHLDTTWYTLDGGVTIYFFSGLNGTIDQGAWDNCNDRVVYLRFYAIDSVGNTAFKEIIVFKSFILTPKKAFAIIVGVSNYPGTSNDLMYCRSDAITMHTMLRSQYNFIPANMIFLTDSEATRSAIFNAFTTIKNQMSSEDIFFFYFSGHGGEASSTLHYICPYDSIPFNPSIFIYDLELDNLLDQLPCQEKFVMVDACNSGGFIPEVQAGNRFIMTACQANQLSWETSELRHGVFTFFFIDSIFVAPDSNGDGIRSMEEQFPYARSETIDYMLGWGELQQPSNYDGISGQTVLFPSIGSLSLVPNGNELHYSFYLYGHGLLRCLNITVCSVYQNISLKIVDLRSFSPSSTGFGYYSGIIQLEEGFNVSGYEIHAEIEGYSLKTIVRTFGDTDNDGLYDILEIINNIDPTLNDTDSDGLSDYDEYYGITSPILYDTDGDGMPDGYEVNNGLNPLSDDTLLDLDGDGLNNIIEYNLGTYVNNPDTDNDGMYDGYEYENDLDLFINDANSDNDGDTLKNILEYQLGSFANNDDTDGDGMDDGWEYNNGLDLFTDDTNLDPDNDGLDNLGEYQNDTDPNVEDTDGDTWNDGDEVDRGTDPLDPDDYPRPPAAISGYRLSLIIGFLALPVIIIISKNILNKHDKH
ncbi:hypothetical protein ES703_39466 [subsurface metagenome]